MGINAVSIERCKEGSDRQGFRRAAVLFMPTQLLHGCDQVIWILDGMIKGVILIVAEVVLRSSSSRTDIDEEGWWNSADSDLSRGGPGYG